MFVARRSALFNYFPFFKYIFIPVFALLSRSGIIINNMFLPKFCSHASKSFVKSFAGKSSYFEAEIGKKRITKSMLYSGNDMKGIIIRCHV